MERKSRILTVVLAIVASSCANLRQPETLTPDPAVRSGRLENGLRYAVTAHAVPKGRASLRLGVDVGSLNESEHERGVAHFLEHMAFNGSKNFPDGKVVEYLQTLGMAFGMDTNASTGMDRTVYQLELPNVEPETLQQALTLFDDFAGGLLLPAHAIEKERGIILSEQRTRDSMSSRTWVDSLEFLYPGSRLSSRIPIGTTEVIRQVSRETLEAFYNAWYRPENMVVVAVGDFDAAAVEAQIEQVFSHLQPRAPARPAPDRGRFTPINTTAARLFHDPQAEGTSFSILALSPYVAEPDSVARRMKEITIGLACAVLNRRLFLLSQAQERPFISARAGIGNQFDFARQATIVVNVDGERWEVALAAAEQELRRALEQGFSESELQEAARLQLENLKQATATASTSRSNGHADELIEEMLDGVVLTESKADLDFFERAIARISVRDCLDAVRGVWNTGAARHIHFAGSLKLVEPEKQILAAYAASQAVAVLPWTPQREGVFAYTDFGPPGRVANSRYIEDIDATLLEFANGVRLNIKPTDFETDRILVQIHLGSGRLNEPPDQPGLAQMAAKIIAAGGLGRHSAYDLRRLLSGKTVNISFGVQDDAWTLSGSTRRQDLLLQLQVLCALITDPGYRPEALQQYREGWERFHAANAYDIAGPLTSEVPSLLSNGDSRFRVPEKEIALSRTLDDVRSWLTPQFASAPIEIAIVGDLDVKAAIEAVARTFGTLPQRQAEPDYAARRKVSFPRLPMKREYTVPTQFDRGIVHLRWAATDEIDVPRAHRLYVLADILADRLRLMLREKYGDTYSPRAWTQLSATYPGYGFIIAQADVAPSRADAVLEAMKAVALELAEHGVSQDELQRVKAPYIVQLRATQRRNEYWVAAVLGSAQTRPERIDYYRARLTDYQSITVKDLDALAAQYLRPERAFELISVPAKVAADR